MGSFYGAKLARAGHETHFLLRSDFEAVQRNGVLVRSPQGDFNVRPKCARLPEEIGPVDLVLIGLKTTANAEFARLLPPLVGPATAVVTLQNGLGNEEQLARFFPLEQILGGLCFVCLNRVEPGLIDHINYGMVVLGEFQRWPEPRTHEIAGAFRHSGVPCKVTDNLARAHWEKLVWNIPFNGLGVAASAGFECLGAPSLAKAARRLGPCLTTDKLLAEPQWAQRVRDLMLEVIAAARALGFDVDPALADQQIERTRTMGAYRPSTLIDFERGQPLELESLFREPLRQGQRAGQPMPLLSGLCAALESLDQRPPSSETKR
ncbi:2-dehydropantoate 2-reductase [Verrucomicrobia bacterium]|nr:2-dehydropantoate 2-reductase [Verrucomicrobiota bacterium]